MICFVGFQFANGQQVNSNVSDPDIDIRIVPSSIPAVFDDYRFLAQCNNFEIENNNNKIVIDAKHFTINRGFDPNPILLIINSEDELKIEKINVKNKLDGMDLDEFENVSNLSIYSAWLTLDSESIDTSYIITEKVSSVGNHVNFYGKTKAEIRLPNNDFNLTFGISNFSQIFVDENLIDIPGDKELYVHFKSSDKKAIFFDRELKISAFSWKSLSTFREDEPIKLTAQGCDGTLSIAEPPFNIDLHGSGTVTIETTLAETKIKNTELFSIDSGGSASLILINDLEPFWYQLIEEYVNNPLAITATIGAIIMAIGFPIYKKIKQKRNYSHFSPEIQLENNRKYSEHMKRLIDSVDSFVLDKNNPDYFNAVRNLKDEKKMLLQHFATSEFVSQKYTYLYPLYRATVSLQEEIKKKEEKIPYLIGKMEEEVDQIGFRRPSHDNWLQPKDFLDAMGLPSESLMDIVRSKLQRLSSFDIGTINYEFTVLWNDSEKEWRIGTKNNNFAGSKSKEKITELAECIKKHGEEISRKILEVRRYREDLINSGEYSFNGSFSEMRQLVLHGEPKIGACDACIEWFDGKDKKKYQQILDNFNSDGSNWLEATWEYDSEFFKS